MSSLRFCISVPTFMGPLQPDVLLALRLRFLQPVQQAQHVDLQRLPGGTGDLALVKKGADVLKT